MKNKLQGSLLNFILITFLLITTACDDDDTSVNLPATTSVTDFVSSNPDFSSLLAALQQTGLDEVLSGTTTFTVFAPNNAAFDEFLDGASLSDVPDDVLTNLLLNHVVNGNLSSTDLSTGYINTLATESTTESNLSLFVDTTDGVNLNGISSVVDADNEVDNGIIHVVSDVIALPTIVDFAVSNPVLSNLVSALTDEGNSVFTDLLSNTTESFTVFAPTNTAFETFLDGALLSDIPNEALAQVLSNHVIVGATAISSNLSTGYANTAAVFNGDNEAPLSLYINTDDGVTLNGISNVVIADIVAINGVIHVVDQVIGLPDITTFAIADPNFSTLVQALTADASFNFVEALQTNVNDMPAPFTVFAPINDAFDNLLTDLGASGLGDIDVMTLASVLELHVVAGNNVRANDLPGLDGQQVTTLGGGLIIVNANDPSITGPDTNTNMIIVTNVQATNGVIHAIDRVIR